VSHLKERKEKNCLNCNAEMMGRFCHICGQENIEPKESAWHLISHFFQDITHFDGKFFSSLRYLVTRPGFLSREYINGRRASYLNPVRMYIFTSAFFFLLFFTFFALDNSELIKGDGIPDKTLQQVEAMDDTAFSAYTKTFNRENGRPDAPMSREQFKKYYDSVTNDAAVQVQITPRSYSSRKEYDSLLKTGVKKHNWLERRLTCKQLELNEKYKGRGREALKEVGEIFLHKVPQILFISLPLLALLLQLLYLRRKEFYYVSHAIFSFHLYIFIFIAILCSLGLGKLNDQLNWGGINFLRSVITLFIFFYLYKAMRNFYLQGRLVTVLKFIILNISFLIIMGILFFVFILFSFFSI